MQRYSQDVIRGWCADLAEARAHDLRRRADQQPAAAPVRAELQRRAYEMESFAEELRDTWFEEHTVICPDCHSLFSPASESIGKPIDHGRLPRCERCARKAEGRPVVVVEDGRP